MRNLTEAIDDYAQKHNEAIANLTSEIKEHIALDNQNMGLINANLTQIRDDITDLRKKVETPPSKEYLFAGDKIKITPVQALVCGLLFMVAIGAGYVTFSQVHSPLTAIAGTITK